MGLAEEVARLILEAQTKGFEEAKQKIEKVEAEVYDLADSYELVEQAQTQFVTAATKVDRAFDWTQIVSPKIRRMTEDFDFATIRMGKSVAGIEQSAKGATRGIGNLQQQITAGSYAFQDFAATSGDLGAKFNSITNNLPTLLMGMGGLGQVISIGAVAAVSLYRNWDSVTGLFEHRNPFPKTAGDLDGMRAKIHDVSEELKKLKEQGTVNDAGLARVGELQKEEANLKAAIKVREQVDRLKEERSSAEEQVVKAFHEAIKETGAKKALEAMEKDISTSANPALKDLFNEIFTKINAGNLDAFNALMEHARANGDKYGNLAREMETNLKEAFKQSGNEKPMDAAVKKFKEENKKQIDALNKQGIEDQREMVEGLAKDAKDGTLAIVKEPLEALVIKGRSMGVEVGKEISHLRNEAEAEAARLFPQLKTMFPKAFEGVVTGIVNAVRDSVDKTIEQVQALEGLTRQEAIRRLNQKRQAKGQANAEGLALDEFTQAAGQDYQRANAGNPNAAPLTPEMRQELGRQIQEQLKQAGVSAGGQVTIGKAMNSPGGQQAIAEAMQGLMGNGLDEAAAMRQLPNILNQMRKGRGAGQAIDQLANDQARQERNAADAAEAQAARPGRRFGQKAQPGDGGGFRSVAPTAPAGGNLDAKVLEVISDTQQIVANGQAVQAKLVNQLAALEARNRQLANQGRQIERAITPYGPTPLPAGQ